MPCEPVSPLAPVSAGVTLRTLDALRTGVALGASRSSISDPAADRAGSTGVTLRALDALRTRVALGASRAGVTLRTLDALRTGVALGASRAGVTLRAPVKRR